ncbi:MAG TPA: YbaK/EbsC family protein [bacterium]|nr:YbaK/EbsC family protein [bacterium]
MGIFEAREHLKKFNRDLNIIEFSESSATVELAAKALNTEEYRIAKTLSFLVEDDAILIVTAGNMKIDNKKYRDEFKCKAKMLNPIEVQEKVGHAIGGVCPFGIVKNVKIYLDESLKQYDYIYPACGSSNSAIKLTCNELEMIINNSKWINVCKEKE